MHEIILTDANLTSSHGQHVGVFEDANKEFTTFEAIRHLPDSYFVEGNEPILDFNFTAKGYWLFFNLTNETAYTHFLIEAG